MAAETLDTVNIACRANNDSKHSDSRKADASSNTLRHRGEPVLTADNIDTEKSWYEYQTPLDTTKS